MPPLITEAQILAQWPLPEGMTRAARMDTYSTHLGELTPGMAISDAYAKAGKAYEMNGMVNPRLAALCDFIEASLLPLDKKNRPA